MEGRQFGDYRLDHVVAEEPGRRTWLASQLSIQREVVLIELTDLCRREGFLAEVRAKAAVDHPLIASVYEAVSEPDRCFVALESIPAQSLARRREVGEPLRPVEMARVLRQTAEAMMQVADLATLPLRPESIHYDAHGVVRIANLAVAGDPDPAREREDIVALGRELAALVADGRPGANRVLMVLAWMRGVGLERPLDWTQVADYGEQIENQLVEVPPARSGPRTRPGGRRKSARAAWGGAVAGIAILVALVAAIRFGGGERPSSAVPALPEPVEIPAGSYPLLDGEIESLPAFRIAAHETTIGEYLEFLEMLGRLSPEDRDVFDADDQPAAKHDHEPDDWRAMIEAARGEGTWRGRPISTRHPVVNVDWWDATAYAAWKGARLPTQEEWFAALRHGFDRPESLEPADWSAVTATDAGDRTPTGLLGMAGSVAEWTRRATANPANPLGEKQYLIVGGSHLDPGEGALSRSWTDDRGQRRPDLGFRTVAYPEEER